MEMIGARISFRHALRVDTAEKSSTLSSFAGDQIDNAGHFSPPCAAMPCQPRTAGMPQKVFRVKRQRIAFQLVNQPIKRRQRYRDIRPAMRAGEHSATRAQKKSHSLSVDCLETPIDCPLAHKATSIRAFFVVLLGIAKGQHDICGGRSADKRIVGQSKLKLML